MSETSAKKDVQKLQRVIVDALEDVKAQDIQVFNTEHLSPLFERVIIASGTSNRQTKALSASVRDKVREGGFGKPRIEGEDNGEWIIADCGTAVVHIMQPVIRQYYNLEEIWGDKPVRLKFGAPKPEVKPAKADKKAATKKTATKALTPKQAAAAAQKAAAKTAGQVAAKTAAGGAKPAAKKPALKAPAKKTTAKTGAKTAAKSATKVVVGKPAAKKTPAKKAAAPARKLVKPTGRKSA
jgi:ribosome-associated protein